MKRAINKRDLILISAILVVAGGFFLWQYVTLEVGMYANITLNGQQVKVVPLDYDMEFYIPQRPNVRFAIREGYAAFICSDCVDQICVNAGFLSHVNQTAACLPNGLLLTIQGGVNPHGIDILVG